MSGEIYAPACLAELNEAAVASGFAENGAAAPPASTALTPRQLEVLRGIVAGQTNKQIAEQLKLAEGTVKAYVSTLFVTLGVRRRGEAAAVGQKLLDQR